MSDPRFSVLTPVYDTVAEHLVACVESVLAQSDPRWELILVDDCSPSPHVRPLLAELAARDPRVQVVLREQNGGIVAASNDALAVARGEFVALLDHDDLLTPDALASVSAVIDADPEVDVVYTDEDKVDDKGRHYDHFHKPVWSPHRLASHMYIGHLTVHRRSLVEEVGGFRAEYNGSQDYDLALRVTERARSIVHVPGVKYHWRASATSTAQATEAKPWAIDAGERAVNDHVRRRGIDAEVTRVHPAGIFRVRRRVDPQPLVSIVIPSRGSAALVDGRFRTLVTHAVRSIVERSTYERWEIVAVLDTPTPPSVVRDLERLAGDRLRIVWFDRPFSFSEKVNLGVLEARGEYVVLLNDDTEVISPDWMESLVGPALDPGVGMVGAKLYFADGTIQHAGHVYTELGADHIGLYEPGNSPGWLGGYLAEREVSGVTAACALMPRDLFVEIGGLTLELPMNFNDVDLCMKVRLAGRSIVYTPHAELFHFESKTRSRDVHAWEVDVMHRRWSALMRHDPYWWEPGQMSRDVHLPFVGHP